MPVEPADIANLFDIDVTKFDDVDAAKAHIEKTWVKAEDAHMNKSIADKIFGKQNGILRGALKNIGKEQGLDINFDEMDPSEGIKAFAQATASTLKELREAKKEGAPSKEVEELQKKYDLVKKSKEDLEGAFSGLRTEFDGYKTGIETEKSQAKINGIYNRAIGSVPYGEGVTNLMKTGFEAMVHKNLKLNFDDDGKEFVTDMEGNRIKAPGKASAFLDFDEAVRALADKEELTKKTDEGARPLRKHIDVLGGSDAKPAAEQTRRVRKAAF